ncbi:hypothetical protein Tco_0727411 [Tanacetum coccineum]|uniref:Uncharacterized protein n=1 Tax=Tanacetum coccineum TaxID=301880 RepID=A0ABQ4YKJ9_9ASTR
MSADSAVTYTSVHSELELRSIPIKDPYEEAARQLLEQAPHSPEYVPADHVPVYIPEPEHPEDLVPAEDEAPTPPNTTILSSSPDSTSYPIALETPPAVPIPAPPTTADLIFPRQHDINRLGRDLPLTKTPDWGVRFGGEFCRLLSCSEKQQEPTIET